jgi:hypothetical protein
MNSLVRLYLNDPDRTDVRFIDDLQVCDIKQIPSEIYSEDNRVLAESVAGLFSHPRAFDTGHTVTFENADCFEKSSFLYQVYAAVTNRNLSNAIERAKAVHYAYCHMWVNYRICFPNYLSNEYMVTWEQLDEMRKRECLFIALAVDVDEREETREAAERVLQLAVDSLRNEY